MEDLLVSQTQIMEAMNQLLINFKKDGADRKTSAHIKKRLSTLESYWQEFQNNHLRLCESNDKTNEYFTGNYYQKTSEFYNETRNHLLTFLPSDSKEKSLLRPATPLQMPSFSAVPSSGGASRPVTSPDKETLRNQGNSSRLEEMLRKQRSNFKAFQRTISSIDLDNVSEKWEYEDILKSVQSRWTIIDALHWEIDSELYEDNPEYEEMFSNYEQKFNNIKKAINSKMWSDLYREKTTPKMDIPMFSGSYHQWLSFKDLFVETIHNNRALSNSQKMQFLKSKLKGEAEKLVQHLQISTDNYQVCWDLLNNRYNNTKLIFNSHMSVLINQPIMQQQSAVAIKRIHDTTNECLNAIKNLGVNIENWDPMIVYILSQKLDADTHNDYIESLKQPRDLPTLNDLLQFLEVKFTALESSKRKQDHTKSNQQPQQTPQPSNFKKSFVFKSFTSNQNQFKSNNFNNKGRLASTLKQNCPICNKNHAISYCETFSAYQPDIKRQTILKLSLCQNCLYNHNGNDCFSKKRCHKCQGNHHTLVHEAFAASANAATSSATPDRAVSNSHVSLDDTQEILLATALIKVQGVDGTLHTMRALIDQGSQTSIITENGAQRLGLPRKHCKGVILGVGAKENNCKGAMNITLSSCYNSYQINLDVFIMNHAVNSLPNKSFSKPSWAFIENIQLADPEFYRSRTIDLLLGADVYSSIIMGGIIKENDDMPIAQQTRLGWILCGSVKSYNCNVIMVDIDSFHKFWAIEDINENEEMSSEDYQCLQRYQETTFRRSDGKYVVRLPLHPDAGEKLGLSEPTACAQFYQLERKFKKDQHLANNYKKFINEYIDLGHMHSIAKAKPTPMYYMPHHAIERPDSVTTSLRVVFNASGKTTSGLSLNNVLFRGPNLQQELLILVLKWRQYEYAFTADLEKMFRQIIVHPDDQLYQCIVWRENFNQPLHKYQLDTVTYGTKSAPFLAMMTLKQLAQDERHRYPAAAKALEQHFYMDDALCGSYDVISAKKLQRDLIDLLKAGGFNLRKFSSNEKSLLEDVDVAPSSPNTYDFKHQESTKALGLTWIAKDDNFTFQCKMTEPITTKPSKRVLLAEISKIYDPCGFLAPAVVNLKLLFQSVWLENLKWDDVIPDNIYAKWLILRTDIEKISDVKIPRWIGSGKEDKIQLHGFCDSSTKAFACVIYARIKQQDSASVTILAAKTRLVPASKTSNPSQISMPRLELSSALLLSKLMTKVKQSLSAFNLEVYGWSDSTAALGWIQGDPNRWKPFVANRVKKITDVMPSECWRYVKSIENPSDCASRGMKVEQLRQHTLWWNGPTWLSSSSDHHENKITYETDLESKPKLTNIVQTNSSKDIDIINSIMYKQSSFTRATRVLAWILRAISKNSIKLPYLTTTELNNAQQKIIMSVQKSEFEQEMNDLSKQAKINSKSKLLCLNPYLDHKGLLRVGGRLKNSNIPYDMKHPYIIPHSGHLTNLLIDLAHKSTFHGGARLTQSWLRQQYWIVSGNKVVRNRLRHCVKCKRHNPDINEQLMGELPEARMNSTRPFLHTGVDYTGFVDIKANKGRGIKTTKGYVAVFVCMVTKAVHLELVSDLSSSAFLAALRRLAARKGTPRHLYSDNGTNFIGANRVLAKEHFDLKSTLSNEFFTEISEMKIDWHFNAPSWPSAGGLWEAAVKSLKHHLRRIVGDQKLTYEEFSTLLAQLEACLNSRPLCALSEDPEDINYLTPAHFLSSGPILSVIETETDGRTRWQLTQKIFSHIWKRWRTEYLVQLAARSKWREARDNIKLNDVVVIHDANLPPGKWALGRVIQLHPGNDNLVRVVSVKTKNGSVIKRPVIKLSILPVNTEHYNNSSEITATTNEISAQNNKTKTSNKNFLINFLSILMTLMLIMTTTVQANYNITKLSDSKYMFFEKIGNMHVIQNHWKLVAYYDMDPYWYGARIFNSYINHLQSLCTNSKRNKHCDIILQQLRHGFNELQYYDRMLLNQHFDNQKRMRRGLVNGVGYIANTLFGVLDERFAVQYEKDISLVRGNQKHLAQLWKNQTSIIEAENNVLKRIEVTMESQYKTFNQHLNNLERESNIIKTEISQIESTNDFIMSSIIANNVLSNLRNIQDTLLDTITSLQHFNVHLLSPTQLQSEISLISSQITKDLSLPIDNIQNDLSNLYKILKVKARMTKKYFIFEIQIPLISRDDYDIYNAIPLYHQFANSSLSMISILPIAEHIAINLKKDTFIPVTYNDFQNCIEYSSNTLSDYLCQIQTPVYERQTDESLCIKNKQSNMCKIISSACQTTWRKLTKPNTYLINCCGQCTFRFICRDRVTVEQMTGVNIIILGTDCVIRGDSLVITPHTQMTNEITIEPVIFAPEIAPVNSIINISVPIHMMNISDNFGQDIDNIGQQIKQLKSNSEIIENEAESLNYHDVHHYVAIYVLAAAGLVAAVAAWVRLRCRRARAARPSPGSEQQDGTVQRVCFKNVKCESVSVKAEQSDQSVSVLDQNNQNVPIRSVNKNTSPILLKCHFRSTR